MAGAESRPFVSVFTLCYNTGPFVTQALDSVLATGYPNLELVIIDDCSTDGVSVKLVEKWLQGKEVRATFIRHEHNWGICRSLNQALELSKGEYWAGIGDDLWLPERLYEEVEFMVKNQDVCLVFGNAEIIDKDSRRTGNQYGRGEQLRGIASKGNYLAELEKGNYIIPPACLYRTSVLKALGGFDESLSFEDWDMFLRLAKSGHQIRYIDHSVVLYRKYDTSVWHSRSPKLLLSCVTIYDKHDLYAKSDTFVSYLNHFNTMPARDKKFVLRELAGKGRWRLAALAAMAFVKAPMGLQTRYYNLMIRNRKHG